MPEEQKKINIEKLFIQVVTVFFVVYLFMSLFGIGQSPDSGKACVVHLKEPMKVDTVDYDKPVTVLQAKNYQWINQGSILQVKGLGRTVLIPASSIQFIELWDPNQIKHKED